MVTRLLSPLEYLVFNINMIFMIDSHFEYSNVQRAAQALHYDTMPAIQIMNDLQ